jgi:UDP-4-amino-4,6-dideoxy-L-N-acetyl-beta-L-altrosamine transaminase
MAGYKWFVIDAGERVRAIPYGRQFIDDDDIQVVVETLRSDYLTTGPKVAEFEESIQNATNSKYCVAVNSGTSALHLASIALLEPQDKVLTTPVSFIATSNSALYAGAKPVFIDIDEKAQIDLNLCEDALKKDGSIKAIYTVHFTGLPSTLDGLKTLREKYGIKIIEDCAHALGASDAGSVGDASIWSFHPVKHITTAEGGAVTTNDEAIYKKVRSLSSHGITRAEGEFQNAGMAYDKNGMKNTWYHEQQSLGYNFRIADINCALGISQMGKLERFVARRKEIAKRYGEAFENMANITPLYEFDERSSYHLFVALFDFEAIGITKAELFAKLNERNIYPQVHYIPINTQPYYKALGYNVADTPNAMKYYEQAVSLPMYPSLTDEEQVYVIETIIELIN